MKYFLIGFLMAAQPAFATKLYNKCMSCHGPKAMGKKATKAPRLAGQRAWYIEEQLKLYKSKKRKGGRSAMMYGQAARLSEKDMKELAKYLEALK